jgi:molybdenum cofactor sulfurtransferase
LRHYNGKPVIKVYKEARATHGDAKTQGPIIAFNVRRADGSWVGKSHFETLAIACNIQMRSGGVCNPGGIATMLQLEPWKVRRNYCEDMRCGDDLDIIGGQPTGILRVSLGAMSTKKDLDTFARFVDYFFVEKMQNSPASPDHSETAESKAQITPIEGCPRIRLPQKVAYKAWSVFHDEWCIVQLETLLPLPNAEQIPAALSLALTPEAGTLVISLLRKDEPAGNYFSTVNPKRSKIKHGLLTPSEIPESTESKSQSLSVTIDLWDHPPERKNGVPARNGSIADPYQQSGIAEFFSRMIGIPCTLARYRPRSSRNATQSCELANCRVELTNKKVLKLHYEKHAKAFKQAELVQSMIRIPGSNGQCSSDAKVVEVTSEKKRTKWCFALRTSKRRT